MRGRSLPVFSGSGPPHAQLAAQIARQAKVRGTGEGFALYFAAVGITFEADFYERLRCTGALERAVMFINLQRPGRGNVFLPPRMAITAAEYLAYELEHARAGLSPISPTTPTLCGKFPQPVRKCPVVVVTPAICTFS